MKYSALVTSVLFLFLASEALCRLAMVCSTVLLINDGLLMVMSFLMMCLKQDSRICSLEAQITVRHLYWRWEFNNLTIKISTHRIKVCPSGIFLFVFFTDVSAIYFSENWMAWWSPILSVLCRVTMSAFSVVITNTNILFCLPSSFTCCERTSYARNCSNLLPGAGVGLCSGQSLFGRLKSPMMTHSCCVGRISSSDT